MLIFALGSACYVYAILQNGNQTNTDNSTLVNVSFIVDGKVEGQYEHEPSSTDQWLFNQLVFSKDHMNEGVHKLTVRLKPRSLFIVGESYLKTCYMSSRQSSSTI